MANKHAEMEEFSGKMHIKLTPWTYGVVALIALIIIVGFSLIGRFNSADYERDVQHWKEKLTLIADSRAADVGRFVSGNFAELRTLSDNPSLKLYLTELQMMPEAATENNGQAGEQSQKTYLRNLLLFTAQRSGFVKPSATDAIPANIPSENKSGLAVLDNDNKLLVGTQMTDGAMAQLVEHAKVQKAGVEGFIDLAQDKDGTLYMGFSVPIYSLQGERNADGQIGKIVAIKEIGDNLFSLLKQTGVTEKTFEVLLMRKYEDGTEYLTPRMDGGKPFDVAKGELAETAFSGENGVGFVAQKPDYRGNKVLAVSHQLENTGWVLVAKVDEAEAFAESGAHRASMMAVFSLIISVIVMIIITMWWYSYSRHALMASGYFKKLATKAQAQEKLLRLVADNQPEAIYIVDGQQKYQFANQQVAAAVEMSSSSIIGKTLTDVRGAARAEQIAEQLEAAQQGGQPIYDVQHETLDDKKLVIRSAYIPLDEIPVASLPEKTAGVLVVEQDVSEVYFERERRLATQKQLVQTLLNLVDRRDPFAANHSSLVSDLSYQIALDMELDSVTCFTAKNAAGLMNIGKIIVPKALLTKTEQLTESEKTTIRTSMDAAADLLAHVTFDGPVVDTLKQWQEKWNGTGQLGLKGEEILVTARIIAVANAFIGMISPRSWRSAISVENANKFLLDHADDFFDQRVVVSLIHFVESPSGREWIESVLERQKKAPEKVA